VRIVPSGATTTDSLQRTRSRRGLIYPVPDPRFPFPRVHFTPRINGDVWLGPNAVLAFGAEAYRRSDVDLAETLGFVGYAGFWKMARRFWRTVSPRSCVTTRSGYFSRHFAGTS